MWFGTYDGLNRWDGYEVKTYRSDGTPGSLSDSNIRALLVSRNGTLYVGTKNGGLNIYNSNSDSFRSFRKDADNPSGLSGKSVRALFESRDGTIWVGTYDGLNAFDPKTEHFRRYIHDPNTPTSLSKNKIRSITEDSKGFIWVGTTKGLNKLDRDTGTVTRYFASDAPDGLRDNTILALFTEHPGELWVGTEHGGLHRMDTEQGTFAHFFPPIEVDAVFRDSRNNFWVGTIEGLARRLEPGEAVPDATDGFIFHTHNPFDPRSLGADEIRNILEDRSGMLWFGTFGGGASRLSPDVQAFGLIRHEPWNKNSLSGREIFSTIKARDGTLWIATQYDGLNRLNRASGELQFFKHEPDNPSSLPSDKLLTVYQDMNDRIWVGTIDSGVAVLDPNGAHLFNLRHDENNPDSLSSNNIWWITQTRDGMMWIATGDNGLNSFDPATGKIVRFLHDPDNPKSIAHARVRNVFEDSEDRLWIGTNNGLDLLDRKTGTFTHHAQDPDTPGTISNNRVTPVIEHPAGILWVGTDQGLNQFDTRTGKFTTLTVQNGLINDSIQGLAVDSLGRIWASTFKGLFRFNPKNEKVVNFDKDDGLQGVEFFTNGYFQAPDGEIIFTGLRGLNAFYPENIRENTTPPTVALTRLRVMNKPRAFRISPDGRREITLTPDEPMIDIKFAALDFHNPDRNEYAYTLEGFSKDWLDASDTRNAVFTNLDPGDYIFKVRAANNDGYWNYEPIELRVTVLPRLWQTTWFRLSALLLIIFLAGTAYVGRVRSLKKREADLASMVENKTRDLESEVEKHRNTSEQLRTAIEEAESAVQAKSDFLAGISHEIRTPVNAVIGLSELLMENSADETQRVYLEALGASSAHLLHLLNDLLDFSKMEAEAMVLDETPFNLSELLDTVESMFRHQAEGAGVELAVMKEFDDSLLVRGDPARIRQILINLIGNAFKFTDHGSVTVTASADSEAGDTVPIQFEVKDTGIGISPEDRECIFEDFVQAGPPQEMSTGTGLGLSISRRLAGLMNGTLSCTSDPGKGSTFTLALSLPRVQPGTSPQAEGAPTTAADSLKKQNLTILLAEDSDLNAMIVQEFIRRSGHMILRAKNGIETLKMLGAHNFDLVLMDLEMPEMNGLDAARAIRNGEAGTNNHTIPIIALTAHVLTEFRKECERAGMNGFIPKPVQLKDLAQTLDSFSGQENNPYDGAPEQILDMAFINTLVQDPHQKQAYGQKLIQTITAESARAEAAMESLDFKQITGAAQSILNTASLIRDEVMSRQAAAVLEAARDKDMDEARRVYPRLRTHMFMVVEQITRQLIGPDTKLDSE